MKLDELEKLSDIAAHDSEWWREITLVKMMEPYVTNYASKHYSDAKFISAVTPQTIKQLIALCRMQQEALHDIASGKHGMGMCQRIARNGLVVYDAFEKEK